MKKSILVLYDEQKDTTSMVEYVYELSNYLKVNVVLLHCYPKNELNQRYDFGDIPYKEGLKDRIEKQLAETELAKSPRGYKLILKTGSIVDNTVNMSHKHGLVLMEVKKYKGTFFRYLNSRASYISSEAKCPVLIVNSALGFKPFQNNWAITREKVDLEIISKNIKYLNIDPASLIVKSFQQKKYTSRFWKLLNSVIDINRIENHKRLINSIKDEHLDLIIKVSLSNNDFQKFLTDNIKHTIFLLDIPILIIHK